jgi:hypothetical protein
MRKARSDARLFVFGVCEGQGLAPTGVVMPAHAGIQYAAASVI